MKSKSILIVLVVAILCGCKSHTATDKNDKSIVSPSIRYEFSGGAGHYNYAPSIIQDKYGIRYGFICENRDPFQIVDYV